MQVQRSDVGHALTQTASLIEGGSALSVKSETVQATLTPRSTSFARLALDVDDRDDILTGYQKGARLHARPLRGFQEIIWAIVSSRIMLLVQMLAFSVDTWVIVAYLWQDSRPPEVWTLTWVTTLVYLVDVVLRCIFFGPKIYCTNLRRLNEMIIVYIIIVGAIAQWGWVSNFRLLWGARISKLMISQFRYVTGENKSRYISPAEDLDIDLSYVTPRLIAMSVPASGIITRMYRNDLRDVQHFFFQHHRTHFHIINLCPEIPYKYSLFGTNGRTNKSNVHAFNIQDHTPPLMDDFIEFFDISRDWMSERPDNLLAVHCRGGKGRTGSIVCAWLLYSGDAEHAEDALNIFALARTNMEHEGFQKVQGVETPSQVRYVHYIHQWLDASMASFPDPVLSPPVVYLKLHKVTLNNMFVKPEKDLAIAVHLPRKPDELEPGFQKWRIIQWSNSVDANEVMAFDLGDVIVSEDVRVSVFNVTKKDKTTQAELAGKHILAGKESGCKFYFMFHTYFHRSESTIEIPTTEMDKAFKVPTKYRPEGSLILHYTRLHEVGGHTPEARQTPTGSVIV